MTADGTYPVARGREITTAAELDALPIGSVVVDAQGDAGLIDYAEVVRFAETAPLGFDYVVKHYGPLTVLFRPDAPQPATTDGREVSDRRVQAVFDLMYRRDPFAPEGAVTKAAVIAALNTPTTALAARGDAAPSGIEYGVDVLVSPDREPVACQSRDAAERTSAGWGDKARLVEQP